MIKISSILFYLLLCGCHTTGHNPYGDSELFNAIIITIAVDLLT